MTDSNSSSAPHLEQRIDVETPEQVVFSYTVAGVGSRSAAALIDYAICIVLVMVVIMIAVITRTAGAAARWAGGSFEWMIAAVGILFFGVFWGYYVLFEGLRDGQTPGKRVFGLRVVQDGGFSVSFAASAVRNLVRVVDMLPGAYAVGMLSIVLSRSAKRLGDYAAGTIVVQERTVGKPADLSTVATDQTPLTSQLTDQEFELVERFLARRGGLEAGNRDAMDAQFEARFGSRLPICDAGFIERLAALLASERTLRARGVASASDTGAAREQHAIVAAGSPRWTQFAATIARVRSRGLKRMSEDEIASFVAEYREVSTDLARLRTAVRGRESDATFTLSRLVAAGHNLLYRRKELIPLVIWRYLAVTVPSEVRRSAIHIGVAALLLFVPMLAFYVVTAADKTVAAEILPAGMLDRAATATQREEEGGGYLPEQIAEARGPAFASGIMTNNVNVSFMAFALGVSAGVGTAWVLVSNGIMIGSALGLFQNEGALHLIVGFIGPHGVLELTAICIAGGAGLLIGSAFLIPGALTRREALVVRGRRSIRLVAAAALLLVVAGVIEGFISPLHLDAGPALLFGALTAIPMIIWFRPRRGVTGAPDEEFAYSEARAFSSM